MIMFFRKSVAGIPVVMACLLLTACGAGTPLHATTDEAAGVGAGEQPDQEESEQEDRSRMITIDHDAKQPLLFHRNLRALNRAFAGINPGEQVQLRLVVPRDGETWRRSATRTLRVDKGKITFISDGESLELGASGEHGRMNAEGEGIRFKYRRSMLVKLTTVGSEPGEEEMLPIATLSPNDVEVIGDEAEREVAWSELQLPLTVEVEDDHYVIVMMVEKSEDFEGTVEWHMPAYK